MLGIVRGIQIIDGDASGAAGVKHLSVANVDAYMAVQGSLCCGVFKEHQITALQRILGDDNAALQLLRYGAFQRVASGFKDILGEPGTVKTPGTGSTDNIADAKIGQGGAPQLTGKIQCLRGGIVGEICSFTAFGVAAYPVCTVFINSYLSVVNVSHHIVAVDSIITAFDPQNSKRCAFL